MERIKKPKEEEFKKVKFAPNYKVSNYGRVISINGYGKTHKELELKHNIHDNGYHGVTLYIDKKPKAISVHRLVAMHFIKNPKKYPEVNHKDGNKNHNWSTNLEWCDYKYNSKHAVDTGLIKVGEKSVHAKMKKKTVIRICKELLKNKLTITEIAKKYDVPYDRVYDIRRQKTWKHITRQYDFSGYTKDGRYK